MSLRRRRECLTLTELTPLSLAFILPSSSQAKEYVKSLFPFTKWIVNYKFGPIPSYLSPQAVSEAASLSLRSSLPRLTFVFHSLHFLLLAVCSGLSEISLLESRLEWSSSLSRWCARSLRSSFFLASNSPPSAFSLDSPTPNSPDFDLSSDSTLRSLG